MMPDVPRSSASAAMLRSMTAIAAIGMACQQAQADLLYFKKGGCAQVPAVIDADRITINLPESSYHFHRDDFSKIEPGFSPDRRMGRSPPKGIWRRDSPARYEALWWAIENGLAGEATGGVRELHRLDPNHAPSARMAATLDRLDRPSSDPEFSAFRKALGISTNCRPRTSCALAASTGSRSEADRIASKHARKCDRRLLPLLRRPRAELKVPEASPDLCLVRRPS